MDGKRFDDLTRRVGKGHSRRSILKSLLGVGSVAAGAVTVPAATDARTSRSRPTVPPPANPSCPLPMQMCGDQCCGEGLCKEGVCCPNPTDILCSGLCCQSGLCSASGSCCDIGDRVCGSICCPASSECSVSGNQDSCCDPTTSYPCGLECCSEPGQCCDGECCDSGAVCLAAIFGLEEYCCPIEQTCDGQCCAGTCFAPVGSGATGYDRSCCSSSAGGNFCRGTEAFAGVGACCSGDAPDCCRTADGMPVCLSTGQCCSDAECSGSADPARCLAGVCSREPDFACTTASVCGETETCCPGGQNVCCADNRECCGATCCPVGQECCERVVDGAPVSVCIDPLTQCCDDDDCATFTNAARCLEGVCQPGSQLCAAESSCSAGEKCCESATGSSGVCIPERQCCDDGDCTGCEVCNDQRVCVSDCGDAPCCQEDLDPSSWYCSSGECCPSGTGCAGGSRCCTNSEEPYCYDPEEVCCFDSECRQGEQSACGFCNGEYCVYDCTVVDCCTADQYCNESSGECLACSQQGGQCSTTPFVPCCGDLLCSNSTCATCVSLNQFGCSTFSDCCDDGSKFCSGSGSCRCGTPTLLNLCTRDGDECCDEYACITTQEIDNPLGGTCQSGTCSSTVGGACPCCAGFFCATDNTCVNACNYSSAC